MVHTVHVRLYHMRLVSYTICFSDYAYLLTLPSISCKLWQNFHAVHWLSLWLRVSFIPVVNEHQISSKECDTLKNLFKVRKLSQTMLIIY